ncbi:hypothetical protein J2D73_10935 [Acetobacter sacchari]|uniref:Uncharacterized protein n=1 Tax=Acetobacter sacchari TaxID=2661687 RepID=A0ABS3LWK3_9PROT|nr:hypothetical protein [Acetobacter sacchari]MBO1360302.1 hypothetical protein [Acetobacter sacchari]
MAKILKCTVNEDHSLSFCEGWSETVGRTNDGRGGGFDIVDLWSKETLKPVGSRIVAYSGEKAKNGVYINYCPWCGASLQKEKSPATASVG